MSESEPEAFYRREYEQQLRRAYLMLGDIGSAQDAVHDAFTAVLGRWDSITEPGPYLNRCVLNACRDRAKSRGREPLAANSGDGVLLSLVAPKDSRMSELWDVLGELNFNARTALVLRYFEGQTENEIAAHLGLQPGSIGPMITRSLRNLNEKVVL